MMDKCHGCGMPVEGPQEYHPHAACLMFQACHDSRVVQANLQAAILYGIQCGMNGISNDLAAFKDTNQLRLATRK